jgi:CHASE2 domain-containing sensor protein
MISGLTRLWSRLGSLPAQRVTWGLVLVFAAWVLLDVFVLRLTGGLAQSTYDTMLRARFYAAAPDPRIVIVDIDEASLARMGKEFGRWPWPRDTLATVLDHVERQQPAAIVWDVVFSDADAMSPGGDAAFNQSVQRSAHSHFSVVRLPKANDDKSQITARELPGLWLNEASSKTPLAVIPPVLPAVAAARLGFNNGYPDSDGVLRRYRYVETLDDGSQIQSLPLSVVRAVQPDAAARLLQSNARHHDVLVAWRKKAGMYPRVSFADVFARAEGAPVQGLPDFRGKIVIIGSTSPSLHDIHPTPLAAYQSGVDSLATVIDNALNEHHVGELPRPVLAALAIGLCIIFAVWARLRGISALEPALLLMPASLLGVSYLTLNGSPVFIDLHMAAGLALLFLTVLRLWNNRRRDYWCGSPTFGGTAALWPWHGNKPWSDRALDQAMDVLQAQAPECRIILHDTYVAWPGKLRWPELARYAAIVGPTAALQGARARLQQALHALAHECGEPVALSGPVSREQVANAALLAWQGLAAGRLHREPIIPSSPNGSVP